MNNESENIRNEETKLFETIKADVIKGKMSMLGGFVAVCKSASQTGRENLADSQTRVIDFIQFETMQNNRTGLEKYLADLNR